MINRESKTRATSRNSTPKFDKVGQGTHPSAKPTTADHDTPDSRARAGFGPGVFVCGAAPRRVPSVRPASCVAAVRPGIAPVAVPL